MNFASLLSRQVAAARAGEPPAAEAATAPQLAAAVDRLERAAAPAQAAATDHSSTPALLPHNSYTEGDASAAENAFELNVNQLLLVKQQLLTDAIAAPTATERTAASKTLLAYSIRTKDKRDRAQDVGGRTIIMNVMAHVEKARQLSAAHES